jgi:hypothetical protein
VARITEYHSLSMRSPFFPNIDEENLLNRVDLVLRETGHLMSLDMDLRVLMYISNSVDGRVKKKQEMASMS